MTVVLAVVMTAISLSMFAKALVHRYPIGRFGELYGYVASFWKPRVIEAWVDKESGAVSVVGRTLNAELNFPPEIVFRDGEQIPWALTITQIEYSPWGEVECHDVYANTSELFIGELCQRYRGFLKNKWMMEKIEEKALIGYYRDEVVPASLASE